MTFSPGVAPPRPVAHRAASHQAPGNTRAAISKAIALGIDVIELDVRLSRDGIPVLLHDATLDRTTSAAGPATALIAAELTNLDAGSWHHPGFADESVPTLAEAFDLIDGAARVTIDVKTDAVAPPVIDVIRRSRVENGVVISGCTAPRAGEVRRLAPEVHLLINHRSSSPAADGEPPHSPAGSIAAALRLGAIGINLDHRHVTDEFRRTAHDAGLQVWAYTVDDKPSYHALVACGVDFITSNWPDEMLPLLNGRRTPETSDGAGGNGSGLRLNGATIANSHLRRQWKEGYTPALAYPATILRSVETIIPRTEYSNRTQCPGMAFAENVPIVRVCRWRT